MKKNKKYKNLGFILLFVGISVSANESGLTLMSCYKKSENGMQITACLDNAHRKSNLKLNEIQQKLIKKFDNNNTASVLNTATRSFRKWQEDQCRMVQSSFTANNDRDQAYISCLIDLTQEQIVRLNNLIG